MRPLFLFESIASLNSSFAVSRCAKFTFVFVEVSAEAVIVFFVAVAAADFSVGFDFPAYLADCLVASVALFAAVVVVDFAAFFSYPFFQGCANLYVQLHLRIPVLPLVVSMKSLRQPRVLPEQLLVR